MKSDSTLLSVAEGLDRDSLCLETWAPYSLALHHIPLCEFQPFFSVLLSFVVRYFCCRMTLSRTEQSLYGWKSQKSIASGTRASSLELAKLVVLALLMLGRNRWCSWRYTCAAIGDVCLDILLRTGLCASRRFTAMCHMCTTITVQSQNLKRLLQDTEAVLYLWLPCAWLSTFCSEILLLYNFWFQFEIHGQSGMLYAGH